MANLEYQIKALQRSLIEGKAKNVHALRNKILSLQKKLIERKNKERINNWLSQ